jgi:hypothetical protein
MWKPGQIVTIGGVVFRIMRYKGEFYACGHCYFYLKRVACVLYTQSRTIGKCQNLIPEDCYFKRLSPTIVMR